MSDEARSDTDVIDALVERLRALRREALSDGQLSDEERRRLDALSQRIVEARAQLAGHETADSPPSDDAKPDPAAEDQQTRALREEMERACARFPRVLERLRREESISELEQQLEIARTLSRSRLRVTELRQFRDKRELTHDEQMELTAREMQIRTGEALLRAARPGVPLGDDIEWMIECELARARYHEHLRETGQPAPGRLLRRRGSGS